MAMLRAAGDPSLAEQARAYFKAYENVSFLGIRSAQVREIEKAVFHAVKPVWSGADALRFADILIRNRFLDAKSVGILLLSRYVKQLGTALMPAVRCWLSEGHCANWATTDVLSTTVLTPLLRQHPELLGHLPDWARCESLWVRRAAAVSLTLLARRGEHLDTAYAIATALLGDSEDLMHKAVGWLLRECGKTDGRRLERFLLANGPKIPRTAVRYAIERYSEATRRRLLAMTR